ncbi:MAG: DUF4198 domain-containing protein [Brevundimonas sp.]|nr:DUF4198 domain-containing protein [Brevundimonas sp.]
MTRTKLTAAFLAGVMLALNGGAALAHQPYLRPNVFDATGRDHVTVEASFTEDVFAAEVVMRSDFFHVVGPNGDTPISAVTYLRDLAVFEAATPVDGTWRISSGPRQGRTAQMYQNAAGDWKMVGEEDGTPPPGAALVDVQSVTVADVYVTRGAASTEALQPTGQGLELKPITHPNQIIAGEDAVFELLLNGQPLANAPVTVFREAGRWDGRKVEADLSTGPDGRFTIRASDPGAYMTLIRHRMQAPAGSAVPYVSYSHTLTFVAEAG